MLLDPMLGFLLDPMLGVLLNAMLSHSIHLKLVGDGGSICW